MNRLRNKIAIVTGAGSGMGRATALLFAAEGAKLVLTDLDEASVTKLAREIGPAAKALKQDVSDEAGWRGVVSGILPKALDLMQTQYGCKPADVRLAIGPGISSARFQVGAEVVEQFKRAGFTQHQPDSSTKGKFLLDLEAIIRQQATQGGIPDEQLWSLGLCTVSDRRFFSHRRDKGVTGRMWAVIMLG